MEVYVFGIIFILILLPILYFIPIGISLKEKVLIAIVSFLLAEIGLFLNQFLGIWKTLLILVLLAVVVTYIVETRIRPRLTDSKGGRNALLEESEENSDLFKKKEEPGELDSDIDSESDGDYDLGQDAIDRLLTEMNKSKTEPIEDITDANLDNIHKKDFKIDNEDYIEPVEDSFINKENTEDEIDVIEPADTSLDSETEIEEFTQNQEPEVDDTPNEDPSQLAKSIDAKSEIDFEKLLEDHTSDGNYYEENSPYDEELLLERSQLFEQLDELEGGHDKEVLGNIELIEEVEEEQSIESVEDLVNQLDVINPIEQVETSQPVESVESMLEELEDLEPLDQVEETQPEFEVTNVSVIEVLEELEPIDIVEDSPKESVDNLFEELDDIEPVGQEDENKLEGSIGSMLEELEEIRPIVHLDDDHPEGSIEDVSDDLDEIGPIGQVEYKVEDSIETAIEELNEIEPIEQVNEEEPVETFESILAELEEITPAELEKPVQFDHFDEEVLPEENEQLAEENLKIMDDLEDITTSEEIQKGDTIVEEYVLGQKDEEISPTRSEIQRQILQTMVSQINYSKSRVSDEEYENLVQAYMQPSLPALEYYTFAYMLIEHYIAKGQFEKLTLLINELSNKFDQYPVIKLQLEYLKEKYNNN